MFDLGHIRNFSIIAHIDHGKSTLADRLIQSCGGLSEREMQEQVLDSMDIERERGITIKAQCVSLQYQATNGETYLLNFIDTPGHVDFSYEVSRSLYACEGAVLVVDAAQGVEAQSVANCYTAFGQGLEILPALNKIDLPQAEPERVCREIEAIIGLDASDALLISAKTGQGIPELLEALVNRIPPPVGDRQAPPQALIIDSWFDKYLGVVSLVRVMAGSIEAGMRIIPCSTGKAHQVDEVGIFTPKRHKLERLEAGEVGFVVAGIKDIHGAPVGDTMISAKLTGTPPLPGFERIKPQVFAGMFPTGADQFEDFRTALEKLRLNDASLHYEPENSDGLGLGFRCGFLGMLHMEIIQERLEREYDLDLIVSAPTVVYQVLRKDGSLISLSNPSQLPEPTAIAEMREPVAKLSILTPAEYLGGILQLCAERRGTQVSMQFLDRQVSLEYRLPMIEVVMDFFDRLKSVSQGYASLDYSFLEFRKAPLARLDILINGEKIDGMASIIHRDEAHPRGRALVEKIKELMPRQMFEVAIQAAIGGKIMARATVRALSKNVTAKCYGGDITRKMKLLSKQKKGKKRMKMVGKVEVPQQVFLAAFKVRD